MSRSMRRRLLACALWTLLVAGCSSGGAKGDGGADAPEPPLSTCLMIRNCVYLCAADAACAARCLDRAETPARDVYDRVVTCSTQACPTGGIDCRCDNECYAGGACLDVVDECTQSLQEGFCLMCVCGAWGGAAAAPRGPPTRARREP
jgi:hypothetical protein